MNENLLFCSPLHHVWMLQRARAISDIDMNIFQLCAIHILFFYYSQPRVFLFSFLSRLVFHFFFFFTAPRNVSLYYFWRKTPLELQAGREHTARIFAHPVWNVRESCWHTNCVCCVCGGAAVDDENKFLTSFLAEWGDDTGKEKREIRWEEAVCAARPRLPGNVEWGFRFFLLSGRRGKKHTTTREICLL